MTEYPEKIDAFMDLFSKKDSKRSEEDALNDELTYEVIPPDEQNLSGPVIRY